jgi:hypothetical protein
MNFSDYLINSKKGNKLIRRWAGNLAHGLDPMSVAASSAWWANRLIGLDLAWPGWPARPS